MYCATLHSILSFSDLRLIASEILCGPPRRDVRSLPAPRSPLRKFHVYIHASTASGGGTFRTVGAGVGGVASLTNRSSKRIENPVPRQWPHSVNCGHNDSETVRDCYRTIICCYRPRQSAFFPCYPIRIYFGHELLAELNGGAVANRRKTMSRTDRL